jgi:flagellar hook assembly protein FlgD
MSVVSVSYQLRSSGSVSCAIYDAAGSLVARLAAGMQPAGQHRITWDASSVRPGVYLCKLTAGGETYTTRLTRIQ